MLHTHIAQLMTHTTYVYIAAAAAAAAAAAYPAIMLLDLLAYWIKVIKRQKVSISLGRSKSRYLFF